MVYAFFHLLAVILVSDAILFRMSSKPTGTKPGAKLISISLMFDRVAM
jgi:hypothetical protein